MVLASGYTREISCKSGKATQIHLFTRHLDAVDWSDLRQSSMLICREIKKFQHDEKKKNAVFCWPETV